MSDLRISSDYLFSIAYNGLNMFLTEYPHMDEKQREEVCKLVDQFAEPDIYHNKVRRPALLCEARQDGAILITPNFVQTDIENCP